MAGCDWVQVTAGAQPPAGGVLTYDAKHGEVVLFAPSRPSAGEVLGPGQTWTFDGASRRWVRRHPPTEPAVTGVIGFDGKSGTVVLLGSPLYDGSCRDTASAQTWTWDGTSWTQQHPAHAPDECSARGNTTMTYDPATRQLLLASDPISAGVAHDWVWNTKTWRPVGGSMGGAAVAYDPSCHALVSFGGAGGPSPVYWSDGETRVWDGRRWSRLLAGGGPGQPLSRGGAGLAFDPALHALIMFGGYHDTSYPQPLNDTWAFVKCGGWIRLPTKRVPPVAVPGGDVVYDTTHHFALMFTGRTWLFS
jgi:hypothetical protein